MEQSSNMSETESTVMDTSNSVKCPETAGASNMAESAKMDETSESSNGNESNKMAEEPKSVVASDKAESTKMDESSTANKDNKMTDASNLSELTTIKATSDVNQTAKDAIKEESMNVSEVTYSPYSPTVTEIRGNKCGFVGDVWCWGQALDGQLGLGGIDEDRITTPREIQALKHHEIRDISCGLKHTVIVSVDGMVYSCGNNDHGQLGHNMSWKKPEHVRSLETLHVTQVSAGGRHNLALNRTGELYSWGDNSYGQLGHGDLTNGKSHLPRLVKGLASYRVLQLSCGENHSLALTDNGELFTWGENRCGQLGLGTKTMYEKTPQPVRSLIGVPTRMISAGSNHSCLLSMSGALFIWGKNSFGQLGVNDEKDRMFPTLCKSLRNLKVVHVSCGENHTAVLTKDGGVFTFGAGSYGQLGHGSQNAESLPRKVLELMGSIVTQIACGRCHTLAYVPASRKLFAFGLGGNGQLGLGHTKTTFLPSPVVQPAQNNGGDFRIQRIFAGGDQCFCKVAKGKDFSADDLRVLDPDRRILELSEGLIDAVCCVGQHETPSSDLKDICQKVFGSSSCLNSSFLLSDSRHYTASRENNGIDFEKARLCFQKLSEIKNNVLRQIICGTLETKLLKELPSSPPDIEALRLYLTLPLCHLFDQPSLYQSVICPFGEAIIRLDKSAAKILDIWWGSLSNEMFNKLVYMYKQTVIYILSKSAITNHADAITREMCLFTSMEVMKKLNKVNEAKDYIVPYSRFYIPELVDTCKVSIKSDYLNWVQASSSSSSPVLSFCNYAFVFDGAAKTMLLQADAIMQMQFAIDEVYRRNFTSLFLPVNPSNPCLILQVSRNNIVHDTIQQLGKQGSGDLKKPLRVLFIGEEAVDEGGVKKEFFMLIFQEILDPKYGMFKYHDEARLLWFHNQTFEEDVMFHLIGVLLGLAIYNSTIIDLHFPLALYKKFLSRPVVLDDLKDLMPSVGRSLESMLEYEGEDFTEVFDLTFELSEEHFGETKTVELCPGGSSQQVTQENKKGYVDAYVDYIFNKSVEGKFKPFNQGFHKACGGRVLELFQPKELEAMVIGNENYDFHELEKNTGYKEDYHRYHPTIKIFWEVFHDLSLEEKKKFLLFLTGSDRIPILGMKAVKVIIQPVSGGEDYLPVAHTCFNLLDLPRYESKEKLKQKLLHAIENSQGFGIV